MSISTPPSSAIIDIGSNSVRLVVYQGPARHPATLFNEKVMAGLGRSLGKTGAIDPASMALASGALTRFAALTREMQVQNVRTVATAAVRDASNGNELIEAAAKCGLSVELLSGEEEATAAGLGVLSAIPTADGIVGDLGGGSLELVRVENGGVAERVSFPLGVLRLDASRQRSKTALAETVSKMISKAGWSAKGEGLPFYLVGGSWRALARLDMHLRAYPLPIVHQYQMTVERIGHLHSTITEMNKADLRAIPDLPSGRLNTLAAATALLEILVKQLKSSETIVSAFGLREGLLFQRLAADEQKQDPLIVAARQQGAHLGRFAEHGDLLDNWIAPIFGDEGADLHRLRLTACLLADVGWHANPEFRAERAREVGLHGHWVAIDAAGRAILAQTLHTALGGGIDVPAPLADLATASALRQARIWGLSIRLAQRLSGGVAAPLQRSRLAVADGELQLHLNAQDRDLYGEVVEKRHKALATAMNLVPSLK